MKVCVAGLKRNDRFDDSPRNVTRSPPASSTWPPSFGISAAPWSTMPHSKVLAAAVPPAAAANPSVMAAAVPPDPVVNPEAAV